MALLKSCCCWKSVRSGSFASGIYTMTFYFIVVTAGSFHVHSLITLPVFEPVLLTFSILMLVFSALSIISSVALIIGLCSNNRLLLLPWIVCISMTTVLDVILSFYLITDSDVDPFFFVLFVTDLIICSLNVYCILCVTSQYQEYASGRGRPRQVIVDGGLPAIRFEPASCVAPGVLSGPSRRTGSPKVSINFSRDQASPPGGRPAPAYRALAAPYCSRSAAAQQLSRSSFSSTSEFSFYSSSDVLPGSRRGSALQPQQGLSPVGETTVPSLAEVDVSFEGSADDSPASETIVVVSEDLVDSSKGDVPVLSRFRHSALVVPSQTSPTFEKSETSTLSTESKDGDENTS